MIRTLTAPVSMSRQTERIIMMAIFSILTFAAAMIRIQTPFTPVPFTLQTFVLFLSVYHLSAKENGLSQASYILAGMIGAPVFAAGLTGALAIAGPTAGYLAGFIVAGMLMSFAVSKIKTLTYLKAVAVFSAGSMIILTLGTMHLAFVYGLGIEKAFAAGFVPFIAAEAMKIAAAAAFSPHAPANN